MISEQNNIKLNAFSELQEGWDGEDGLPVPSTALDTVRNILNVLPRQPDIFPTGRGSVQIEGYNDIGDYFEFEVFAHHVESLIGMGGVYYSMPVIAHEVPGWIREMYDIKDVITQQVFVTNHISVDYIAG